MIFNVLIVILISRIFSDFWVPLNDAIKVKFMNCRQCFGTIRTVCNKDGNVTKEKIVLPDLKISKYGQ